MALSIERCLLSLTQYKQLLNYFDSFVPMIQNWGQALGLHKNIEYLSKFVGCSEEDAVCMLVNVLADATTQRIGIQEFAKLRGTESRIKIGDTFLLLRSDCTEYPDDIQNTSFEIVSIATEGGVPISMHAIPQDLITTTGAISGPHTVMFAIESASYRAIDADSATFQTLMVNGLDVDQELLTLRDNIDVLDTLNFTANSIIVDYTSRMIAILSIEGWTSVQAGDTFRISSASGAYEQPVPYLKRILRVRTAGVERQTGGLIYFTRRKQHKLLARARRIPWQQFYTR